MGANCFDNNDNNKNQTELIPSNKNNNSGSNDKCDCDIFNNFACCFKEKLCDVSITYFFPEYENEDKIKLKELKKTVLKRQEKLRGTNIISVNDNLNHNQNNNIIINDETNEKNSMINQVLEDMCIYGNIMKEQIKEEKKNNPENFIEIKDALNLENEDKELFALGLIAHNLEQDGTEVAIEKQESQGEDELSHNTTCLQFISNGMTQRKRYDLHFDFGEQKNEEYLNDQQKYEELKENLKEKLSKDYNISKDKIIVTLPQRGSFRVQVIFQSEEFNNLDLEEFKSKFKNDDDFPELQQLKEINEDAIMSACKLTRKQLDSLGNRNLDWGVDELRGNRPYYPPLGWTGIGLKVLGKYDDGDDTWIGMDNSEGEWNVAYHGIGRGQSTSDVKKIVGLIYKGSFKKGSGQVHKECNDKFHSGKVGEGVYCTPNIETAEEYCGISEINGKSYKTVLMVRVNPDAVRSCNDCDWASDYWVVNGTTDEIRPYRILYKCVN